MSNATDIATKSSYCRNRKHSKCSGNGCECNCHATAIAVAPEVTEDPKQEQAAYDYERGDFGDTSLGGTFPETPADALPGYDTEAEEDAAIAEVGGIDPELESQERAAAAVAKVANADEATALINDRLDPAKAPQDSPEVIAAVEAARADTGCGGCDNGEDCGAGCADAAEAKARKRLARKPRAAKAPKEPKPVVKGTVDSKLSNAHKRAIRMQMVAYLGAMPIELAGDLEGVTAEEAAAYVDQYWVKYIDPARDKARHAK